MVGGGVSSMDISRDLGPFAKMIFQSTRNGEADPPAIMLPDNAVRIGEIDHFELLPDSNDSVSDDNHSTDSLSKIGAKIMSNSQDHCLHGVSNCIPISSRLSQ